MSYLNESVEFFRSKSKLVSKEAAFQLWAFRASVVASIIISMHQCFINNENTIT